MALKDIAFVHYSDAISVDRVYYYSVSASNDVTGEVTNYVLRDGVNVFKSISENNDTLVSYSVILEVSPTSKYVSTLTYAEKYPIQFIAYGDNKILATLPADIVHAATAGGNFSELLTTSYYLTSNALTANNALSMSFAVNNFSLGRASGALKLSQQVIKALLSRVRSNRFSLGEGTGLLVSLGARFTRQQLSEVLTDAIDATEAYIIAKQNSLNRTLVSDSELLAELLVSSVKVSEDRAEATITIITEAGSAVALPVLI